MFVILTIQAYLTFLAWNEILLLNIVFKTSQSYYEDCLVFGSGRVIQLESDDLVRIMYIIGKIIINN